MSIEQAEKLKRELTDKWVVVAEDTPELRRFAALTGQIKTVNMNCRALVQFDGPEDISWYDIDPQFLTVVDGPRPKVKAEEKAKPSASADTKTTPAAKPAAGGGSPLDKIRASAGGAKPAPTGGSPLDKIRAQSGGGGDAPAAESAGGSPLDKIRASGAAKAKEEPAEETPAAAAPKADEKKPASGSPLDQIRAQGGFKG